jgi:hypothetical protein
MGLWLEKQSVFLYVQGLEFSPQYWKKKKKDVLVLSGLCLWNHPADFQ